MLRQAVARCKEREQIRAKAKETAKETAKRDRNYIVQVEVWADFTNQTIMLRDIDRADINRINS